MENERGPTVASSSSNTTGSAGGSVGAGNPHDPTARRGVGSAGSGVPTAPSTQPTQMRTKNITFGELTDTIIANDYGPNPMHLRAPHQPNFMPYMQDPQGIIAPDRWKMNRRVQKEAEAAAAAAAAAVGKGPSSSPVSVNSNSAPGTPSSNSGRSNTPGDERNIIRMPQEVSPRKYIPDYMLQSAAHADFHYPPHGATSQSPSGSSHAPASIMRGSPYDGSSSGPSPVGVPTAGGPGASAAVVQNHTFDTMKYVQNRIVEVMRTEDDHRAVGNAASSSSNDDHHQHHNDHRAKDMGHEPRKTPNQYDERDGIGSGSRRSSSANSDTGSHNSSMTAGGPGPGAQQYHPPVTTFAATTYAYPYSALNVPSSVTGLPTQMSLNAPAAHQMQPSSMGSAGHKQPSHMMGGMSGVGVHDNGAGVGSNSVVSTTTGVAGGSMGGSGAGSGIVGQSSQSAEPKPLLSAQYEALSDED